MNHEEALSAEKALAFLGTYQYPKIKAAVQELRQTFSPVIERCQKEKVMKSQKLKYSYKMFDPIIKIQNIIEVMNNAISLYEEACNNLEKTQRIQNDLLHAVELLDLSEEELLNTVKELHAVRRVRREAKDFTEIMLPLYDLACKYQPIVKEFSSTLSEMQKIAKGKESRSYKVREKVSLADKFEQQGKELVTT
jgi:dsDNA-specific endonuclease/ATPase MutS2